MEVQIRYCSSSDGTRLAFASGGTGPPIVFVPDVPFSHVRLLPESPGYAPIFAGLADVGQLTWFDFRGSGLSSGDPAAHSLRMWLDDLDAIVQQAGPPVALVAWHASVPTALHYAARHPERVTRLALFSGWVSGAEFYRLPEVRAMIALFRASYEMFTENMLALGMAYSHPEAVASGALLRQCARPEAVAATHAALRRVDCYPVLPALRAPLLLIHSFRFLPIEVSERLIAATPDGRLIHLPVADTPDFFTRLRDALCNFVCAGAGAEGREDSGRAPARGPHPVPAELGRSREIRTSSDHLTRTQRGDDTTASGSKRALAVLPFDNLGGDPEQEFFADGMTEDLITELARLPGLLVIARNSCFVYKRRPTKVQEIGRDLGVDYVLEGSVRRAATRVRISAQLIDAASGHHLWAERFDRDLVDVFALQDDVVKAVAAAVERIVGSVVTQDMAPRSPSAVDPSAYEIYLQGRYAWNRRTARDVVRAVELFEQAIRIDGGAATFHAALAQALVLFDELSLASAGEVGPRMVAAAERAVELDPTLADGFTALAGAQTATWRWSEARTSYDRAIALAPSASLPWHWKGHLEMGLGFVDEGLRCFERAHQLDPLSIAGGGIGRLLRSVLRGRAVSRARAARARDRPRSRGRTAAGLPRADARARGRAGRCRAAGEPRRRARARCCVGADGTGLHPRALGPIIGRRHRHPRARGALAQDLHEPRPDRPRARGTRAPGAGYRLARALDRGARARSTRAAGATRLQ